MKFKIPQNFWWVSLIVVALICLGLFIYFFWFLPNQIPEEIKEKENSQQEIEKAFSSVYRYDSKQKQYLSDPGNSWQNKDFVRYIYDQAPEGSEADKCYYFFYDNLKEQATYSGQRRCNANLTISLGEGRACSSQGEDACTIYIYAIDSNGLRGEMTVITYHIDWQKPQVSQAIEKENNLFLAEVTDNLKVGNCWLYFNEEKVGLMEVEDGQATLNYPTEEQSYTFWVTCVDHYEPEREVYLNVSSGQVGKSILAQNHAPQISSCRVVPAQGSREAKFLFFVEASDLDQDPLSYGWDFGDGQFSDEKTPTHSYSNLGTFEPKVVVSDGKEEARCSTAWVIVSE